ncbi:U4/U6 small nuclear ribonucleoprotein Prp31 [Chloropicon primus]|uniref:U4/U6 small nuclear ribonucleoprotein Prp31 n=1 Tax=Chloropicon primus TaxID=1764295 RepID=A0A5B8MB18_9CHLO|nr:U4/U6 small nuclear ribonucleoprotein Prp31 [Chloropicon primus]|eukprot:QDZ17557.1 U4/U6 small nuclear ribonucleoprotein Prp31 [Chloropicon primus]
MALETFMADLEDLSSDGEEGGGQGLQGERKETHQESHAKVAGAMGVRSHGRTAESKLASSERYKELLELVDRGGSEEEGGYTSAGAGGADELVQELNSLVSQIDAEIHELHLYSKEVYKRRFPELETLVQHPVDYARVVKKLGNASDLTEVNLEGLLPSATIMVVSVTASTSAGAPLDDQDLQDLLRACDLVLKFVEDKKKLLKFVEQRMGKTAPNLSVVLGSECASRLVGLAGGLTNLSKIPACNIQVLGSKKTDLAGFSSSTNYQHRGIIADSPLINGCPPFLRKKACKLLAGKCALLARVDAYGEDPSGSAGERMKQEIQKKIDKWQEPPPARIIKPLAIPDSGPKKKRGGRRLRKMKERYGMTDLRRAQNRVNFNKAEEEIMDGEDSVGLGLIGQGGAGGMGKLRLQVSNRKQKISKAMQKKLEAQRSFRGSGASTSGLSSSIAFTPVQGIELVNPLARNQAKTDDASKSGTESYFSKYR